MWIYVLYQVSLLNSVGISSSSVPSSQPFILVTAPNQVQPVDTMPTTSLSGNSKKDDINVMPASVEDHFAKALGDQWSKLNSGKKLTPPSSTKTRSMAF